MMNQYDFGGVVKDWFLPVTETQDVEMHLSVEH